METGFEPNPKKVILVWKSVEKKNIFANYKTPKPKPKTISILSASKKIAMHSI